MANKLRVGDKAPEFSLKADRLGEISLSSLRGKTVVLFFYPKDDTPGCTVEACEFRDIMGDFDRKGVVVFGISADSLESHQAFSEKFHLNFPLLVDQDHRVSESYGVWGWKEWNGKRFEGISRTTFIIDPNGKIKTIYENVNPTGHGRDVLNNI